MFSGPTFLPVSTWSKSSKPIINQIKKKKRKKNNDWSCKFSAVKCFLFFLSFLCSTGHFHQAETPYIYWVNVGLGSSFWYKRCGVIRGISEQIYVYWHQCSGVLLSFHTLVVCFGQSEGQGCHQNIFLRYVAYRHTQDRQPHRTVNKASFCMVTSYSKLSNDK